MRVRRSGTRVPQLLIVVALAALAGCGASPPVEKTDPMVAYIDARTQEVFRLPRQSAPPVNPSTGKGTLSPALYCPKCAKWHAAPPFEVLQRTPSALQCRKCRSKMETAGP